MASPVFQRTSFNIQARYLYNRPGIIKFFREGKPSTALIMDDDEGFPLSWEIAEASPGTLIQSRKYFDDEADMWRRYENDPQKYVDEVVKPNLFPGGAFCVLCEPGPSHEDLPRCLAWLVKVMKICFALKIKLVVGNFQTVYISWELLMTGVFDEYLTTLAAMDGFMWGGWHEYAIVDYTSNIMGRNPYAILAPEMWNPDFGNYPSWQEMYEYEGVHWHVFRYMIINRYCRLKQIPIHRKIINEIGYDHVMDLENLLNDLQNKYHHWISGVNSVFDVWRDLYPDIPVQWVAFQQSRFLERCMTPDVRGWNNYAMSNKEDWWLFDWQGLNDYLGYLTDTRYVLSGVPVWRKTDAFDVSYNPAPIPPRFPLTDDDDVPVPPIVVPPVVTPPPPPPDPEIDWKLKYKELWLSSKAFQQAVAAVAVDWEARLTQFGEILEED